jgi:hypothetical protein
MNYPAYILLQTNNYLSLGFTMNYDLKVGYHSYGAVSNTLELDVPSIALSGMKKTSLI